MTHKYVTTCIRCVQHEDRLGLLVVVSCRSPFVCLTSIYFFYRTGVALSPSSGFRHPSSPESRLHGQGLASSTWETKPKVGTNGSVCALDRYELCSFHFRVTGMVTTVLRQAMNNASTNRFCRCVHTQNNIIDVKT